MGGAFFCCSFFLTCEQLGVGVGENVGGNVGGWIYTLARM